MTSTSQSTDNETVSRYQQANAPLTAIVAAVPAAAWTAPSPCAGWAARDVVRHLIETQRDFLGLRGLGLPAAPDVDADPAAAWSAHSAAVLDVIADSTAMAAEFDGHFGRVEVGATLVQFYVWDMIVHRWDIARSAGLETAFNDAELDQIERGADGFGEAIYLEGVCVPGVTAADDADRTTRVLAKLGRRG